MKPNARSWIRRKVALGLLVFGAVAIQFVRPSLPNPAVTANLSVPADVAAILRKGCYDCHSNETSLRWYDEVVPAYWLVARDVRDGRAVLNFSELGAAPAAVQKARLFASVNQIRLGAMPPAQYTMVHRSAVITAEEIAVLERYLQPAPAPAPSAAPASPAILGATSARQGAIARAPNGLAFAPDYADWKPLSTTDRFDNDSLRVILGNDIAARAVAEGKTVPWPDGAALAKVAWAQRPGPDGTIVPGAFKQVEFMIKDARAYADSDGWGWGRWLGDDLKPYGKDASFVKECTGCHAPMRGNDYVFTMPIASRMPADRWNASAALPSDLPVDPLAWRAISLSVDPATDTMSTIYADAPGATLARVTWTRQADAHWFGGRIPGAFRSIEILKSRESGYESITRGTPIDRGSPLQTFFASARNAHAAQTK